MPRMEPVRDDHDGHTASEPWPVTMLWRVPVILRLLADLAVQSVPVDVQYSANVRALARAGRTEDVQRARFLEVGEWPIAIVATSQMVVLAPRATPRFNDETARALIALLRRAAEMSHPTATITVPSTQGRS